jgi:hypothetical protein
VVSPQPSPESPEWNKRACVGRIATAKHAMPMNAVDFYFDFVSPYPWLASHQLGELRECTAVKFCFVPVLFAALLDHHSNMGPAEIPAKRRYTFQDTQSWTVHLGWEFKGPPAHPFNPLKPLRVTSAIESDDLREALAVRLLDAARSISGSRTASPEISAGGTPSADLLAIISGTRHGRPRLLSMSALRF